MVAAQGQSQRGGQERGQGPQGSQNTAALGAFTCGTKRETEARSGGRQGADPREPRVQDRNPDLPPTPERLSRRTHGQEGSGTFWEGVGGTLARRGSRPCGERRQAATLPAGQGLLPGPPPSAHLSGRTLQPRGGRGALQPGPRGALSPAPVRGPQSPRAASLLEAKAPGEGGLLGGLEKRKVSVTTTGPFFSRISRAAPRRPTANYRRGREQPGKGRRSPRGFWARGLHPVALTAGLGQPRPTPRPPLTTGLPGLQGGGEETPLRALHSAGGGSVGWEDGHLRRSISPSSSLRPGGPGPPPLT